MSSAGAGPVTDAVRPVFAHLQRLTDGRSLFEHAEFATPRLEHGYCVDDAARALVVVCREPDPSAAVAALGRRYLDFVLTAVAADGRCRNRMDSTGQWRDKPDVGDWWGRALWGLGVASARAASPGMRARALAGFRVAAQQRTPNLRSIVFAGLGAAEVLAHRPDEDSARALLADAVAAIGSPVDDPAWPWPESRLTYANAALPEVLIVAGDALSDARILEHGLELLDFLLAVETRGEHLSVTAVEGRGPADVHAAYDQQPIEVASLADACASAYRVTGDPRWAGDLRLAWQWFLGANDSGTLMFDPDTGAGYDGLISSGRNLNQGAESTLAMLSTAQHVRRLDALE